MDGWCVLRWRLSVLVRAQFPAADHPDGQWHQQQRNHLRQFDRPGCYRLGYRQERHETLCRRCVQQWCDKDHVRLVAHPDRDDDARRPHPHGARGLRQHVWSSQCRGQHHCRHDRSDGPGRCRWQEYLQRFLRLNPADIAVARYLLQSLQVHDGRYDTDVHDWHAPRLGDRLLCHHPGGDHDFACPSLRPGRQFHHDDGDLHLRRDGSHRAGDHQFCQLGLHQRLDLGIHQPGRNNPRCQLQGLALHPGRNEPHMFQHARHQRPDGFRDHPGRDHNPESHRLRPGRQLLNRIHSSVFVRQYGTKRADPVVDFHHIVHRGDQHHGDFHELRRHHLFPIALRDPDGIRAHSADLRDRYEHRFRRDHRDAHQRHDVSLHHRL